MSKKPYRTVRATRIIDPGGIRPDVTAFVIPEDHPSPQFVLWLDVPITRRLNLQQITDPTGALVYTSGTASDALDWLDQQEAGTIAIMTALDLYLIRLRRAVQPRKV